MEKNELIAFISCKMNDEERKFTECGYGNGYVAVPPDHPYARVRFDDEKLDWLFVHGGITYSEPADLEEGIFLLEDAEFVGGGSFVPDDYWVFGFDTCRIGDNLETWGKERLINETLFLKKQLEIPYITNESRDLRTKDFCCHD
jgi:hypothetical protein